MDIHTTDPVKETRRARARNVMGLCIDTGASRLVIKWKELNGVCNENGIHDMKVGPSNQHFRFADNTFKSLGIVHIELDTPLRATSISVGLEVLQADVPALLGVDVMEKEGLNPFLISNRMSKRRRLKTEEGKDIFIDYRHCPTTRSRGNHLYAGMKITLVFILQGLSYIRYTVISFTRVCPSYLVWLRSLVQNTLYPRRYVYRKILLSVVTHANGSNLVHIVFMSQWEVRT